MYADAHFARIRSVHGPALIYSILEHKSNAPKFYFNIMIIVVAGELQE